MLCTRSGCYTGVSKHHILPLELLDVISKVNLMEVREDTIENLHATIHKQPTSLYTVRIVVRACRRVTSYHNVFASHLALCPSSHWVELAGSLNLRRSVIVDAGLLLFAGSSFDWLPSLHQVGYNNNSIQTIPSMS